MEAADLVLVEQAPGNIRAVSGTSTVVIAARLVPQPHQGEIVGIGAKARDMKIADGELIGIPFPPRIIKVPNGAILPLDAMAELMKEDSSARIRVDQRASVNNDVGTKPTTGEVTIELVTLDYRDWGFTADRLGDLIGFGLSQGFSRECWKRRQEKRQSQGQASE